MSGRNMKKRSDLSGEMGEKLEKEEKQGGGVAKRGGE